LETLEASPDDLLEANRDRVFVIKKLGFTEAEFEAIMGEAPVDSYSYRNDDWQRRLISGLKRVCRVFRSV